MGWVFRSKATPVWLLLVVATIASWVLGSHGGVTQREGIVPSSVVVMLIAMVKIRLVLVHFMELKRAPLVWRVVFEAWVVVVATAVVAIYSLGATPPH